MKSVHGMPFVLIAAFIGCFARAAPASIVLENISITGGLEPYQDYGLSFQDYTAQSSGYEHIAIPSLGMYNTLSWDFREDGATIRSEMSAGDDPHNVAWVIAHWGFRVEKPVSYTLESSTVLLDTRFMEYVSGYHICLSPGCDGDRLDAGTISGTLLPGHYYVLDFQPGLWNSGSNSASFRFQVPEPSRLALLGGGLLSLVIGLQSIAAKKRWT